MKLFTIKLQKAQRGAQLKGLDYSFDTRSVLISSFTLVFCRLIITLALISISNLPTHTWHGTLFLWKHFYLSQILNWAKGVQLVVLLLSRPELIWSQLSAHQKTAERLEPQAEFDLLLRHFIPLPFKLLHSSLTSHLLKAPLIVIAIWIFCENTVSSSVVWPFNLTLNYMLIFITKHEHPGFPLTFIY